VLLLLWRRLPLLSSLLVDERLHALHLQTAHTGTGAPPALPPPPLALRKAAAKDGCVLRLMLLHTLRCLAAGGAGAGAGGGASGAGSGGMGAGGLVSGGACGGEARACQLLWLAGGMEGVSWDAQADFVR
jgi:hypothetical protein